MDFTAEVADMRAAIIGSGPVGMTAALLLARKGVDVTLIDRDPGPVPGQDWQRVGVMQFRLPHGFRPQVRTFLAERLPDVHAALLARGAVVMATAGLPSEAAMLSVRRSVFERTLWEIVSSEPAIDRVTSHVNSIKVEGRRVTGVVAGARFVEADIVLDASGRSGRLSAAHRPAAERVDCKMAYASREYRLHAGATPGPTNGGAGYITEHDGFMSFVFTADQGTFMVLVVRRSEDRALADLRLESAFEAACRILPGINEWTDPARSSPIDVVRAGAGLVNSFTPQPTRLSGLLAIGDAFCITNPTGARGIVLGLQSAEYVADLVTSSPPDTWTRSLDEWGLARLRPWFQDHLAWEHTLLRRWTGRPIEIDGPIGIDVLGAAAEERPELRPALAPFWAMAVGPEALGPARDTVRSMLRQGWQPPTSSGVTRDQLIDTIRRVEHDSGAIGRQSPTHDHAAVTSDTHDAPPDRAPDKELPAAAS